MSSKYPRTFHLPWSPGGTSDDKKLKSVESFLSPKGNEREIVITEKLDGSNSCLTTEGVFARSHGKISTHPAFNYLKGQWAGLVHQLRPNEEVFGENCFAVHSITYKELPDYFFVFGIRQDKGWLSFDDVVNRANELTLQTAPVLFRGTVKTESELEKLTESLMKQPSHFGGEREGSVIRLTQGFLDQDFSKSVAKFVRKDHVQTDDHWMHQKITKQPLKK